MLAWSALHAAFWMHAAFVDWLRWLRWRAMSILPARKQLIAQPPAHLGIVFAKEEICIERIADLVAWCAEAGIGCITLCDWDGTLLAAENELSLALSTRSIAHSSQAVGGTADAVGVSLRVVTLQTGRDDLVEAAQVDGASSPQIFKEIIWPQVLPVAVTVLLIRMIEAFKIVDLPNIMTGGGPGTATESMTLQSMFVWRANDMGSSAAIAYMLLILTVVVCASFFNYVVLGQVKKANA